MATNRRVRDYRRRGADDGLSRERLDHLCTGCAASGGLLAASSHYATRALLAAAWELLREPILERWLKRYPGTRPFAFWLFAANYPQQQCGPTAPADHIRGWRPPDGPDDAEAGICHRVPATWFFYPVGTAAFAWLRDHGQLAEGEQLGRGGAVDLDGLLKAISEA